MAWFLRVMGPFSLGSLKRVAKKVHQHRVHAVGIVLLGLREELLVEGGEVKQLVFADSAAEGAAELLLGEAAEAGAVGEAGGQAGPLLVFVQGAVQAVGAGLGDHVDEPAGAASEFGGRAVGHHLHFLDGVQAHGKGGALAAALLAEEGIVVVGAIDGDVVVDALLPVDGDLVAIGSLHDGDAGGEGNQAEEVASVIGQIFDRSRVEVGGAFDAAGFEDGRFGGDGDDLFDLGDAQREGERDGLAHRQVEPFADGGAETGRLHGDFVGAERQQQTAETALVVGRQVAGEIGTDVGDGDGGAGDGPSGRVGNNAFDGAGIGLRLGQSRSCGNQQENTQANAAWKTHVFPS